MATPAWQRIYAGQSAMATPAWQRVYAEQPQSAMATPAWQRVYAEQPQSAMATLRDIDLRFNTLHYLRAHFKH